MTRFNGLRSRFLLCCLLTAVSPLYAQDAPTGSPAEPVATAAGRTEISRSLSDLGYREGLQQSTQEGSLAFYLPVPQDVDVSNPRLELHYTSSAMLGPSASLQVALNGTPRQTVPLAGTLGESGPRTLVLSLDDEDLRRPYLEVRVKANFSSDDTKCTWQGTGQDFVTVLPQSRLAYGVPAAAPRSIRGFLSTLPHRVRIAIAAPAPGPDGLRAGWMLASSLQAQGHQVSFSSLPEGGDIVIGPRAQLALNGVSLVDGQTMALTRASAGATQLAIAEPFQVDTLAEPWSRLLAGEAYSRSVAGRAQPVNGDVVPLAQLGVDTTARRFSDAAEWTFNADALPAGRALSKLRLNLIVPPGEEHALVLYVFQNNALRGLVTMPKRGGTQTVVVPLVETGPTTTGPVRVVLMRQTTTSLCHGPVPNAYAQLLPSSTLETRPNDAAVENIAAFAGSVGRGYSVHVPVAALAEPSTWVGVLAGLGKSLDLDPRTAVVQTTDQAPEANRPFVWLGAAPPAGFSAPIAFDRGRIQVKDSQGSNLLDTDALPDITTTSLLRNGTQRGLWLRKLGEGVPVAAPDMKGSPGDLMFGDTRGVLTSLDTRQNDVMAVDYPDYATWWDRVQQYKGWLFALGWVLLTVLVVVVIRKLRRSQA
ncbi:MAG: cellulose biosynthesis cyclic di-GMP-binding regulatory protein BcsB [Pseudoxanthomonas sp.]